MFVVGKLNVVDSNLLNRLKCEYTLFIRRKVIY